MTEYSKKYYVEHKEKYRQWHLDNADRKRAVLVEKRKANPSSYLHYLAKKRSKVTGVEFTIDVDDIVVPTHCPYLGCELTTDYGDGYRPTNISLDRIDSSKGYTKGNVEVISSMANKMKSNATKEELVAFAKGVLNHVAV